MTTTTRVRTRNPVELLLQSEHTSFHHRERNTHLTCYDSNTAVHSLKYGSHLVERTRTTFVPRSKHQEGIVINAEGRGRRVSISDQRGMNRRDLLRWTSLGGVGLVVGAQWLTACTSDGEERRRPVGEPPTQPTGTLKIANNGEPTSLDPAVGTGWDEGAVLSGVYERLLRFKGDTLELDGELAESFESSPDAREWTFTLTEGISFHDGEPLTSSAVKASLQYYAKSAGIWAPMVPANAIYDDSDPRVLRIASKTPFPDLARNVAVLSVISPKLVSAGTDAVGKTPIGTGPFKFVRYHTAREVVLEANADYRGPGPYLEKIEIPIIPDASARVAALRSGGVDLVRRMRPPDARQLRDNADFVVTSKTVGDTIALYLNTKRKAIDDVRVRQAIAHAIDREAISKAIFDGVGVDVLNSILPRGNYGYQSPSMRYAYDPEKAKRLIADTGLPTPISLELAYITEVGPAASLDRILQVVGRMLSDVGITLNVKKIAQQESARLYGDPEQKGAPDGYLYTISMGLTTGPWTFGFRLYDNYTGLYDDSEFQELQERVTNTPDGPKRLQAFAEMQEYVARELPVVPLFEQKTIDVRKASVQGYESPKIATLPDYGQIYLSS